MRDVGGGRSRRVIIPVRTRFRSIENVTDARARAECIRRTSRVCIANSAPTFSDGPPRNNYSPGADFPQHCKMETPFSELWTC